MFCFSFVVINFLRGPQDEEPLGGPSAAAAGVTDNHQLHEGQVRHLQSLQEKENPDLAETPLWMDQFLAVVC